MKGTEIRTEIIKNISIKILKNKVEVRVGNQMYTARRTNTMRIVRLSGGIGWPIGPR